MVSPEIYNAILELEYRYARVLDDDRLEEWPDLFVERGVYKVIPRENWHREPKLAIMFCWAKSAWRGFRAYAWPSRMPTPWSSVTPPPP